MVSAPLVASRWSCRVYRGPGTIPAMTRKEEHRMTRWSHFALALVVCGALPATAGAHTLTIKDAKRATLRFANENRASDQRATVRSCRRRDAHRVTCTYELRTADRTCTGGTFTLSYRSARR